MVDTGDLVAFSAMVRETDLMVRARANLRPHTERLIRRYRKDIEEWTRAHPDFTGSMTPLVEPECCPDIVRAMLRAGKAYDVGPMAAVAGAVAEFVGKDLSALSPDIIVENGGDIYLRMARPVTLMIYAGPDSPFNQTLRLRVDPTAGGALPRGSLGVCTSSGTVGHSFSLGRADAVMTVAADTALADAAATAIGNRIRTTADIEPVLDQEKKRGQLSAVLIIMGQRMGAYGDIEVAAGERPRPHSIGEEDS
ncbi:MAG: UPF0280 family protein [Alphaproteobacteria bacterium]